MSAPADVLHDLAAMLRWLGDHGWKPLLMAETELNEHGRVTGWVCFPQGSVRTWQSFRDADPVSAARRLYLWAQDHPNEPPVFLREAPAPDLTPLTAAVASAPTPSPIASGHPVVAMPAPTPVGHHARSWWSSITSGWEGR